MNEEPLISINVDKRQTLVFYDDYFLYKGKSIFYKDIEGVSYLLTITKQSINLIPTGMDYSFEINFQSKGEIDRVHSSASSIMYFKTEKQNDKQQIFNKLVYLIDNLIKPFVLINLLIKYNNDKEFKLGDSLTIAPDGMYKKRLWRSPDFLPWNQYYNSKLHEGNLYIFKDGINKEAKTYFTCSMDIMNAVVMPDLLNFLFNKNGIIDKATEKELGKRKNNLILNSTKEDKDKKEKDRNFCPSCKTPIDADSKFCSYCGSKIK